jgi:hypothetical protein
MPNTSSTVVTMMLLLRDALAVVFAERIMFTMPSSMFRTRRKILPWGPPLLWTDHCSILWFLQAFAGEEKAGMPFA